MNAVLKPLRQPAQRERCYRCGLWLCECEDCDDIDTDEPGYDREAAELAYVDSLDMQELSR